MPQSGPQSELPSTLPTPKVNPLLNPVLSEHMGRWAEVYFTTPPEKREEAVLELVRELEAENSRQENGVTAEPVEEQISSTRHSEHPSSAGSESTLVGCPACGEQNFTDQKFCGMCGVSLADDANPLDFPVADLRIANPLEDPQRFSSEYHVSAPPAVDEASLVHTERQSEPEFHLSALDAPTSPSTSYSYRVLIGAVLAILVVTLAYMAWRGGQATSQISQATPQIPPAEARDNTAAAPTASATHSEASNENGSASATKPSRKTVARSVRTKPRPVYRAAIRRSTTPEKIEPVRSVRGNGAEEFATAQSYLNGASGRTRDSAAAADWLWKAVAKQNADATILLSDLYLKGDGVPKNCDQARVLLDAAASKGRKDAGERLRHLRAFGCE